MNGRAATFSNNDSTFNITLSDFNSDLLPDQFTIFVQSKTILVAQEFDLLLGATAAPQKNLSVGNFTLATRDAIFSSPSSPVPFPAIDFGFDSQGCDQEFGDFQISQFQYDTQFLGPADNPFGALFHLTKLVATFRSACVFNGPAVRGTITYTDTSKSAGGTGGTPTPTPTPTPSPTTPPAIILSDDVRATPLVLGNASSATVFFSTFVPDTTTGGVTLSVTTDDVNLLASVTPLVITAAGTTDGAVTISTTATTNAGTHAVTLTATTSDGSTSSATIFVTVICDPPFILGLDQPQSSTVSPGRPALLSVKASGSGPFTYQWFSGASGLVNFPLAGGTTPNFTTSAINDTTAYWVRITNPCGSIDSQTATITVSPGAKGNARR
ncbi:MAG TPA: hypothetical protein VN380_26615 [Thermoanaerobaculia bacterium]|nr:hypothetical protein [Thermoanaerobaculia bacterium]